MLTQAQADGQSFTNVQIKEFPPQDNAALVIISKQMPHTRHGHSHLDALATENYNVIHTLAPDLFAILSCIVKALS